LGRTGKKERASENAAAASIRLSDEVFARIDQLAPAGAATGGTLLA
jgi:diketogulonate reductase-like aldo/keto reductase